MPDFSSRIFSCLTFRSFIHFEFIFGYGVRKWSRFILLHVSVQLSQHHLLKRLFSTGYSFLLCQRLVGFIVVGQFLCFLSSIYVSVFVAVPYCLDDYSFVIQPKVQNCDVSRFFLFQHYFGYLGSFLHTNFRIICSSSVKNAGAILIGIALTM